MDTKNDLWSVSNTKWNVILNTSSGAQDHTEMTPAQGTLLPCKWTGKWRTGVWRWPLCVRTTRFRHPPSSSGRLQGPFLLFRCSRSTPALICATRRLYSIWATIKTLLLRVMGDGTRTHHPDSDTQKTIRWKPCGLHRTTTPTVEIPKTTAAYVRGLRLDNEANMMPEGDRRCHASSWQYLSDQLTATTATSVCGLPSCSAVQTPGEYSMYRNAQRRSGGCRFSSCAELKW